MNRRKRGILLTVGLFLVLMFALSTVLNVNTVIHNYCELQMGKIQEQVKRNADYIRSEMEDYAALSWLLDYWESSFEEMDIPPDGTQNEAWIERHKTFYRVNVKEAASSEVQRLSPEAQKEFAEVCYERIADFFDRMAGEYGLNGLNCTAYLGDNSAFAYFQGMAGRDADDQYVLGDIWPFTAELHPVAAGIFATGMDSDGRELAKSTTDRKEYMFVHSPVYADGVLRALVSEDFLWSDVKAEITDGAYRIGVINAVQLFIVFTLLMVILSLTVIHPLMRVQKSVRTYKEQKDSGSVRQNLEKIAKNPNEIGFLAEDVSGMMTAIDGYVEEVRTATAEKERIGTELALAAKIQADMLPGIFPPFPGRREFEIYASMDPAKEVGGDFYDFFLVDDDHLCLVIADVSGKGVPAALFMMSSRIILSNHAMVGKSPAEILKDTNAAVCAGNQEYMFVTVWLGILEISTGRLTAANAGHEYPVMTGADGKYELYKDKHGLVIGGMPGVRYTEYELMLTPGTRLFVYTDGVPEATNAQNELFGTDRMLDALNRDVNASPDQVLRNVRSAVDAFVQDAEQFDDLTMLCIEYKGKQ